MAGMLVYQLTCWLDPKGKQRRMMHAGFGAATAAIVFIYSVKVPVINSVAESVEQAV